LDGLVLGEGWFFKKPKFAKFGNFQTHFSKKNAVKTVQILQGFDVIINFSLNL